MTSFLSAAFELRSIAITLVLLLALFWHSAPDIALADTSYIPVCTTPLNQNWSDPDLITVNNDWSGVPGIIGYKGVGLTLPGNRDPRDLLQPTAATDEVHIIANVTPPNTAGGFFELELDDPVVAMRPSNSVPAPHLVLHLDTRGATGVTISYLLRDLDVFYDANSQVALQYRVGTTGNFVNLPEGYVEDASEPESASKVTPVSANLPSDALDQAQVQVRIIMVNMEFGMGEWIGIDDISVTCDQPQPPDDAPTVITTTPGNGATDVGVNSALTLTFSEAVDVADATLLCNGNPVSITGLPASDQTTITLTPDAPLPYNAQCTLTLAAASVVDRDGDPTPMAADFVLNFTTEEKPVTATPSVSFQTEQVALTEGGSAQIAIELDWPAPEPLPQPISVDIAPKADSTAAFGTDYSLSTQNVVFDTTATDGATRTITVTGIDDALLEGDETIVLQLQISGAAATIDPIAETTITISDDETATVAFALASSTTTAEANEDDHQVAVELTLLGTTGDEPGIAPGVSIDVELGLAGAPGTASAGSDYTFASPATLTFNETSQLTQNVTLTVIDDSLVEGDESINLSLISVDGPAGQVSLGAQQSHIVTLPDDDTATVQFQSPTSTTGESNATYDIPVILTLNGTANTTPALAVPVTASVVHQGGSATEGSDFTLASPPTVTFPANSTSGASQSSHLTLIDDSLVEGDETVELALSVTSGPATVAIPGQHTLTIQDNDSASVSFASAATSAGEAATSTIGIKLSLPDGGALERPVTVDVTVTGGTATDGSDFNLGTTQVIFSSGSEDGATENISLTGIDDALLEGDETIELSLAVSSGPASPGTTTSTTVTLTDDETAQVAFALSSSTTGAEANEPAHEVAVELTLTGTTGDTPSIAPDVSLSVQVALADTPGTATIGTDYTFNNPTTLTFSATGDLTQTVTISVIDDNEVEGNETVELKLTSNDVTLGQPAFHTVTIQDDDQATVAFASASASVSESGSYDIAIILSLPEGSSLPVPVVASVTASGGSAGANDYALPVTQVTFNAGSVDGATRTLTLTGTDDGLLEGDETLVLELQVDSGPATTGAASSATITLTDDETAQVAFASATSTSSSEASAASTMVNTILTVNSTTTDPGTLAPDVTLTADISAAASPGTATAGSDFTLSTSQVTFPPGSTSGASQPFVITVIDDSLVEGSETVNLQLTGISGPAGQVSLGGQQSHTLTIPDDDSAAVHFASAASSTASGESNATHQVEVTLALTGTTAAAPSLAVPVVASVSYQGGSATPGDDFTFTSPLIVIFGANSVSGATQPVGVTINDDQLVEGDETIELALAVTSGPATTTTPDHHVLTIKDDDSATIAFAATSSTTAETGTHFVQVALTLPAGSTLTQPVTVDVVVTGGSASSSDFVLQTTQLTFAAGSGSDAQNITLSITGDFDIEGNETIILTLQNVQDASGQVTLGTPDTHTVTIEDDDGISITFADTASTVDIAGADVTFDVRIVLSIAGGGTLDSPLAFSVSDELTGTASSGHDYEALDPNPQMLEFAAGSSNGAEAHLSMTALAGHSHNVIRTVNLKLGLPENSPATIGTASGHTISLRFATQATPALPDNDENAGKSSTGAPASLPVALAETFICDNLSGQSGGLLLGTDATGNVTQNGLTGNTFCTVMALDGAFLRDPAEIGHPDVLGLGVIHAVNIYGLLPGGTSVVDFDNPARVCMSGSGLVLFLSAAEFSPIPVALAPLPDSPPGWTCVAVTTAGKVIMTGERPAVPAPAQAAAGEVPQTLEGCRVTTTHQVRLRQTPDTSTSANIITTLPYDLTLTATERVPGWYRVIYLDGQGWVSASYLTTSGSCGN
ncbi:MAG: Calx-beta domain-containing protein [Chloroflexota bacterium]